MRRAAALFGTAIALAGCSPTAPRAEDALLLALDLFSSELPGGPLCLHPDLSRRNPAVGEPPSLPGQWIEQSLPEGFEDLASQPAAPGPSPRTLAKRLPPRWYLRRAGDDLCFEFTAPIIRGDRGVVSVEAEGHRALVGRRNYWLRWRGDGWTLQATTKGYSDI